MTDIQLWHVPDCPLVDQVRDTVERVLDRANSSASVHEFVGDCSSPSLLINGIDVVTGVELSRQVCCRLDLPTEQQILAALRT